MFLFSAYLYERRVAVGSGKDSENSKSSIEQKGKQIQDPSSLNEFIVVNSELAVQ